jgi:dihydroorotase
MAERRDAAEHELLIRGGAVVDSQGERRADVLVRGDTVVAVGPGLEARPGLTVLDAGGCVVAPGLVDLHAHLRQPGDEVAETVETGSRAAAVGGYTAVLAMPNTEPAIDNASIVRDVLALGRTALVEVRVAAAITVGRAGSTLVPMGELAALGVHLFTDDGRGVQDAGLMRHALEYASDLGVVLAEHCEDEALAGGGHMHEGAWSSRLGIVGQPALAEEAMLSRDLALVRETGGAMHFLHLSTATSAELLDKAKTDNLRVSAEVTPHHLALTDEAVVGYDPVFKVNPPLRTPADVAGLRKALLSGVIDAVATDHAPHSAERKEEPFDLAPFGMTGLETALAVVYTLSRASADEAEGVAGVADVADVAVLGGGRRGQKPAGSVVGALGDWPANRSWPLCDLFAAFSWKPARIARLDRASGGRQGGPITEGSPANLVVFDPTAAWTVEPPGMVSRSSNTPFRGMRLVGRVRHTVFEGEPVVVDSRAQR